MRATRGSGPGCERKGSSVHRTASAPAIATLICLVLLGIPEQVDAQKIGQVERVQPSARAPRATVLEWTSAEGQPYWYRLPAKKSKRTPNLVLMLHGTGLNHGWSFWNYPVGQGKFRPDDIVISPDGLTPGNGDTFNFMQGKKDGEQIAGLIREFRKNFPIDRVYVYGHSQGAFFAYWFAGAYTELVDGIVAHAGNVLEVNHNALAKKKVAIGILHGKADAVVPVECAYRTEKIYRDQGYQKIKLEIVEGLTEQAGHWPLPTQVAQMFEWLDSVSADHPELALDVAKTQLEKKSPDFETIVSAVIRARRLVKKAKGEEREKIEAEIELFEQLLDHVARAHRTKLDADAEEGDDSFDAALYFQVVHLAFREWPGWVKLSKSEVKKSRKQDKQVSKALQLLARSPSAKSVRGALGVLERASMSTELRTLEQELERLSQNEKRVPKELAAQIEGLVGAKKAERAAMQESVDQRHRAELMTFRKSHPELPGS